jgi:hypothetical protein
MDGYSKADLERLSYCMDLDVRHKGDIVVKANEAYDYVCFIKEGTAALVDGKSLHKSTVITLEEGSGVADECSFLGLRSCFSIVVKSKTAKFYRAKRSEFMSQVSQNTYQQLKQQSQYRLEAHMLLRSKATARVSSLSLNSSRFSSLTLASPPAVRSMQRNVSYTRSKGHTNSMTESDYAKCKLQLELMRSCTTDRLLKFSAAAVKRFKLQPSLRRC